MAGKHARQEGHWKVIISIIILVVLILAIGAVSIYGAMPKGTASLDNNSIIAEPVVVEDKRPSLSVLKKVDVTMPDTIGGYAVLGKIEIPKINVEQYSLEETTDESLNLAVTRFWGQELHQAGNFSIIGHNYKNLFKRLKELEIGDTFTITAKDGSICTYEVFNIYVVNPDEMECIEDSLPGKREVTLITCTVGGMQRLIVKAQEYIEQN